MERIRGIAPLQLKRQSAIDSPALFDFHAGPSRTRETFSLMKRRETEGILPKHFLSWRYFSALIRAMRPDRLKCLRRGSGADFSLSGSWAD